MKKTFFENIGKTGMVDPASIFDCFYYVLFNNVLLNNVTSFILNFVLLNHELGPVFTMISAFLIFFLVFLFSFFFGPEFSQKISMFMKIKKGFYFEEVIHYFNIHESKVRLYVTII